MWHYCQGAWLTRYLLDHSHPFLYSQTGRVLVEGMSWDRYISMEMKNPPSAVYSFVRRLSYISLSMYHELWPSTALQIFETGKLEHQRLRPTKARGCPTWATPSLYVQEPLDLKPRPNIEPGFSLRKHTHAYVVNQISKPHPHRLSEICKRPSIPSISMHRRPHQIPHL